MRGTHLPTMPATVPTSQMARDWFRWNLLASLSPATSAMTRPTQVRYATISVVFLSIFSLLSPPLPAACFPGAPAPGSSPSERLELISTVVYHLMR